jgi:hypothetical protein
MASGGVNGLPFLSNTAVLGIDSGAECASMHSAAAKASS